MNNYKNLFLNIKEFDDDKIIYIKPLLFYKVAKNMGIYYKNKSKKLKKQKIIIQTPKMIVPFAIKSQNYNDKKLYQMCLSFSTLTNLYNEEEIKDFFNFIKKIDNINESTINEYKKKWDLPKDLVYKKTLRRSSTDFPYYMNLNLPYDADTGFLFNIYDENANKSNIDIIKKRSIVSAIIELTDIKFTDIEFKCNWTLMQVRKFKPYSPIQEFFMSACFICDQDDPEDLAYAKLIEQYQTKIVQPIKTNPNHILNPYIASPVAPNINLKKEQITIFKPPSITELLTAKNLLKKTDTIVKGNVSGKVLEKKNDNIISPPPPPNTNKIIKEKIKNDNLITSPNIKNKIIKEKIKNDNLITSSNTKNKIIKKKTKNDNLITSPSNTKKETKNDNLTNFLSDTKNKIIKTNKKNKDNRIIHSIVDIKKNK